MADLMVYKMYASTQVDAAATLDMAFDGAIQAMILDVTVLGANALDEGVAVEVSFASVSGFNTNDTRASIIGCRAAQEFLTSGGSEVGKTVQISFGPDGIPVGAGERMYLHVVSLGGATTSNVSAWLFVRVTGGARADRRRL